jgi:D-serine deaminase-like pyridoxal phosphate-dependent protein
VPLRVCIDIDASFATLGGRVRAGTLRSPVRTPADAARLPQPYLPAGLRLDRNEGAGEVQTPLIGPAADGLAVGGRAWLRHAKAASCASGSRSCTWWRAAGSRGPCPPTGAREGRSAELAVLGFRS